MAHVHFQTCTSPSFESTHESLPSVSRLHDAEAPTYTSPPQAKPLNAHSNSFNPAFHIEELLLHQNRNYMPDAVFHHVNNNSIRAGIETSTQSMPPLPPPNSLEPSVFPILNDHGHVAQPDRYDDLLDRIEQQQEDLRDARDDLVGSRFRLRAKRQELRVTRRTAATQMGAAFDIVKRYLLQNGLDLPGNIKDTLSEADNLRDNLGVKEIEYEEHEEKYNVEEWKYTEKEKAFIDGLPGSTPMPVSPPAPAKRNTDTAGLTRFSFGFPDSPAALMDSNLIRTALDSTNKVDVVDTVQVSDKHGPRTPQHRPPSSKTSTALPVFGVEHSARQLLRPHRESSLVQARLKWSDTRKRIDGWLLDTLKCSKFQQHRLRGLEHGADLSDDAWWRQVVQYWNLDSSDETAFHTGDTTISGATMSQPASINTRDKLFDMSGAGNLDTRNYSGTPLLATDQIVDALEVDDIPATIEPRDLEDIFSKDLALVIRTSSSPSTAPSIMTRTSSVLDDTSMGTMEGTSSCTSSEDGETICRVEPSDDSGSLPDRHNQSIRDGTSTDTYTQPSFATRWSLMSIQRSLDQPVKEELQSPPPDNADEHASCPNTPPYPPGSEGGHSTTRAQFVDRAESPFQEDPFQRPLSPPKTRSCSPGAERQSQCHVAPFFRVDSPTSWNFPLLRLTPYPKPTTCTNIHRLEYLPFVSLSDSPFRLPGPTKVPEIVSDDLYD